jgi:Immunity protein Imm1
MNVEFFDRQDDRNPLNGLIVDQQSRLLELLDQLRDSSPFFCELLGQNGHTVLLGIGGPRSCVQYSRTDGTPPYLMAVSPDPDVSKEFFEFLIADTPTPVPSRYCMLLDTVKDVAEHFQATGERSPMVSWEEI